MREECFKGQGTTGRADLRPQPTPRGTQLSLGRDNRSLSSTAGALRPYSAEEFLRDQQERHEAQCFVAKPDERRGGAELQRGIDDALGNEAGGARFWIRAKSCRNSSSVSAWKRGSPLSAKARLTSAQSSAVR